MISIFVHVWQADSIETLRDRLLPNGEKMVKSKSFAQKASVYWAVIKANPSITEQKIQERYKGTPYGMNNIDRRSLVREMKDSLELRERFIKSDASDLTKDKFSYKNLYKNAKNSSIKGKKIALSKAKMIKDNKKRGIAIHNIETKRSTRQTIKNTFKETPTGVFKEFYCYEKEV